MGASARPSQPDPREYLLYLRETGQADLAAEFEQYLRETGQEFVVRNVDRQQAFESGRLGRDIARRNQNDAEMLAAEQGYDRMTTGLSGAGVRGLGAMSAAARQIPGAEALQAGVRSFVRDQPYREALSDLRGAQAQVPTAIRVPLEIAGGAPAAMAIPGGAFTQGAAYGGLLGLLNPDSETVGGRVGSAALGALAGGVTGKVTDIATTAARGLMAPRPGVARAPMKAQRAEAVAPLYAQAEREGAAAASTPMTPELGAFLNEPDIAPIVRELSSQRQFRGLDPRDPRMLDAVYKALSDIERQLQKPMLANDPTRVNTGRFNIQNVQAAKQQALDAMSRGRGAPMPTYAPAVEEFAAQSRPIEAFERGYDVMGTAMGSRPRIGGLERNAPETLAEWLATQPQNVRDAAVQGGESYIGRRLDQAGVLGLVNPLRSTARNALFDGGDVLRQMQGTNQTPLELLRMLGVSSASAPFGSR